MIDKISCLYIEKVNKLGKVYFSTLLLNKRDKLQAAFERLDNDVSEITLDSSKGINRSLRNINY